MADRLSSISAFFPCYNDAGSITTMVERAAATLCKVTDDFEIIVVDDGSRDESVPVLQAMSPRAPYLRIVRHERNRGYGAVLRTGFESATREYVFYTDGDGQYDPEELPVLVRAMREGICLVNGFKIRRADPFHRVIIGRTYQVIAQRAFGIGLRDVDCDFRLIRAEALRRIPLTFESGAIGVELVRRLQDAGCRMVEVPVHHYPRLYGHSEFFVARHVVNLLHDLWRLWWQLRRERAGAAIGSRQSAVGEPKGRPNPTVPLASSPAGPRTPSGADPDSTGHAFARLPTADCRLPSDERRP